MLPASRFKAGKVFVDGAHAFTIVRAPQIGDHVRREDFEMPDGSVPQGEMLPLAIGLVLSGQVEFTQE